MRRAIAAGQVESPGVVEAGIGRFLSLEPDAMRAVLEREHASAKRAPEKLAAWREALATFPLGIADGIAFLDCGPLLLADPPRVWVAGA